MPRRSRVLVLEDEWLIAEQIETALNAAGYEVIGPVGRVRQAVEIVEGGTVDAAVLDINVHHDRSFAVAEKLAQRATPFVFLSGYSDVELPDVFGERPLMQKPVDPGRLCDCVKSLLSSATGRDAATAPAA